MKYNTSVITYFVIPAGATTGQRIVLDGVLGEIDLYNAANQLVGQWKPSQFSIFAGTPNVGQSIQILPNAADDVSRAAIEFRATTLGTRAVIDSTDDGVGRANLQAFGAGYSNVSGVTVNTTVQMQTGFAGLLIIDTNAFLRGGQFACQDGSATMACYQTAGVSPVVLSSVACNNNATPQVLITPDSTQTGGIKTPTIVGEYSSRISSAWLRVLGAGVWATITMQGGYVAGNPAPAITLLPDGTMAFRGVMTTRAAPASGDTCMTTGVNLHPSAVRALLVFTLLNPNTVLQLNWNTNGTFRLFGGGPNPPGNTGVSLDSIPPIPVTF